jgi:hypothetical protein|tara:strand:- start:528 stop:842 length:315 start_codon:yes stop_codon:yes gene_type:complete
MTEKEFDKLRIQLNEYSFEIMRKKRPEYTNKNKDVLHNFKNTAKKLNISPLKVWAIFFDKQLQSIFTHVDNENLEKSEPIKSRFADVINYCYLGYALFEERKKK